MSEPRGDQAGKSVLGLLLEVIVDPVCGFRMLRGRAFRVENVLIPLLLFVGVACFDFLVRIAENDAVPMARAPAAFGGDSVAYLAFAQFSGVVHIVIGSGLAFLGSSLVLWLAGSFLIQHRLDIREVVSVSGMGLCVPILGGVATVLLVLATGNLDAQFSLSFFLSEETSRTLISHFFASLHLFHIWYVVVLGAGLSSLTGLGFWPCLTVCTSIWILPRLLAF